MIDYEDYAADCLRDAGSGVSTDQMLARAQVFATLALVQAVQDLVIPLDGIIERLDQINERLGRPTWDPRNALVSTQE